MAIIQQTSGGRGQNSACFLVVAASAKLSSQTAIAENMDIESYFQRIGYKKSRNELDLETLTEVLQHQTRTIPFENLSLHCGESMELDLETIFNKLVRKKRGGWCLQLNHLFYWALSTMGFEATMLGGYVYNPPAKRYSKGMIHLLVQVTLGGKHYIVDAAFGRSYQMWEPMELISGKEQSQVPSIFRLTEENGIWYLDQIRREQYIPNEEFLNCNLIETDKCPKLYSFTLVPRTIKDFESENIFLQTSPTSVFIRRSFCSVQTPEGVLSIVGTILTRRKFNYKDNVDLLEFKEVKEEEVEEVLKTLFGISLEKKLVLKNDDVYFTV